MRIERLNRVLQINSSDQSAESSVVRANQSPGQLDNWSAVMEGAEDSWLQRNPVPVTTRRTLIVAAPHLESKNLSEYERRMWADLVRHYDVIVWQGENVALSECLPVRNSHDFWQRVGSGVAASQQELKQGLAAQQLNSDEYVLLDPMCIEQTLVNYVFATYAQPDLALSEIDASMDLTALQPISENKLAKNFSPDTLNHLTSIQLICPTEKELDIILAHCRNLQEISIKYATNEWVQKHLSRLSSIDSINFNNYQSHSFHLPDGKYKMISFRKSAFHCLSVEASDASYCKVIRANVDLAFEGKSKEQYDSVRSFPNYHIKEIHSGQTRNVVEEQDDLVAMLEPSKGVDRLREANKRIDVNATESPYQIDREYEELTIQGEGAEKIGGQEHVITLRVISLNRVEISNPNIYSVYIFSSESKERHKFEYSETVEELELQISDSVNIPDISNLPNLKILKIRILDKASEKIEMPYHPHLRELSISSPGRVDVAVRNLPLLQSLNIDLVSDEIDIAGCKNIQNIKIKAGREGVTLLNVTDCHSLLEIHCASHYSSQSQLEVIGLRKDHPIRLFKVSGVNVLNQRALSREKFVVNCGRSHVTTEYTEEDAAQSAQRSTSRYRQITRCHLDDDTVISYDKYVASGSISAALKCGEESYRPEDYRTEVFSVIDLGSVLSRVRSSIAKIHLLPEECGKNERVLVALSDQSGLKEINRIGSMPEHLMAGVKAMLARGAVISLPHVTPVQSEDEFKIYVEPSKGVKVFWNPRSMQYMLKVKHSGEYKIYYASKINKNYSSEPIVTSEVKQEQGLVKDKLKNAVLREIRAEVPALYDQIFSEKSSMKLKDKIQWLKDYILKFGDGELEKKPRGSVALLVQILKEQKGACRHRSFVFFILARVLGVPVNYIQNEYHAFCEVPYVHDGKVTWIKQDLGGYPVNDMTEEVVDENLIDFFAGEPCGVPNSNDAQASLNGSINTSATSPDDCSPSTKKGREYIEKFKYLSSVKTVTSINETFGNGLAPLLLVKDRQEARQIHRALMVEKHDSPYLIINSAADIRRYWQAYHLDDEGNRLAIDGPVKEMIKNPKSIIIVNWHNFSATEIASAKSLLDAQPTILGEPLVAGVKVIGISMKDQADQCAAFSSRCQRYQYNCNAFADQHNGKAEEAQPVAIEVINLHHRFDWREVLLGSIRLQGRSVFLKPGVLVEAINKGKSLLIHNPPKDENFQALLQQIEVERRFFYNGEWVVVPPDFTIKTDEVEQNLSHSNVHVDYSDEAFSPDESTIFLHANNVHECMRRLQVVEGNAREIDGYLAGSGPLYFYVTENIIQSDWLCLQQEIGSKYPNKEIYFKLAPGVCIEGIEVAKTGAAGALPKNVVTCSDPDFYIDTNFQGENPLVIDVTPATQLADLIGSIRFHADPSTAQLRFSLNTQSVLAALQQGRKVVLNGRVSDSLMQQLRPLLELEQPYVELAGERRPVTGSLVIVSPVANPVVSYQLSDYLQQLPPQQHANARKIEQFFSIAAKLNHKGRARPDIPRLTFQHLQRLMRAIDSGVLHSNNKIKGLFLYDYAKGSEAYAFLNVVAKRLFHAGRETPTRLAKLKCLLQENAVRKASDLKPILWQVLNCLNINDLARILADLSSSLIFNSNDVPILCDADIESIFHAIGNLDPGSINAGSNSPHLHKREQQLLALLKNQDTQVVFIKGAPGTGKTYTLRNLQQKHSCDIYSGIDSIEQWLQDASSKTKILFLDEANMMQPGSWDFLKGLTRTPSGVYFQGRYYPLDMHHKIVATGNPESFPYRYYHDFFQRYAETILFREPDKESISNLMLLPILGEQNMRFSDRLFDVIELAKVHNPQMAYSIRDLENLAQRLKLLLDSGESGDQALAKAVFAELIPAIADQAKAVMLIQALIDHQSLTIPALHANELLIPVGPRGSSVMIPSENRYLLEAIQQDLRMRQKGLADPGLAEHCKSGILLQGEPGLGKSTLFKMICQEIDAPFYEVSAGTKEAHEILLKAFHEGAIVILDELNLDESLESLLNHLLTGRTPDGQSARSPGFMLLASQNASTEAGRKSVSSALMNRLHVMQMQPYTKEALESLAQRHGIEEPQQFVAAYLAARAEQPQAVNTRTFFTALKQLSSSRVSASATASLFGGLSSAGGRASSEHGVNEELNGFSRKSF